MAKCESCGKYIDTFQADYSQAQASIVLHSLRGGPERKNRCKVGCRCDHCLDAWKYSMTRPTWMLSAA